MNPISLAALVLFLIAVIGPLVRTKAVDLVEGSMIKAPAEAPGAFTCELFVPFLTTEPPSDVRLGVTVADSAQGGSMSFDIRPA